VDYRALRKSVGLRGRLENEELHNVCSEPRIIGTIKSRRRKCVEHVTPMGDVTKL
jgi:hypothetical protein